MPNETDPRLEAAMQGDGPPVPLATPSRDKRKQSLKQELLGETSLRVVMRQGRGRSGSSTGCRTITEFARRAGRPVLVADGDVNNPTLSRIYPPGGPVGLPRPESTDLDACREWLANALATAVERRSSLVVDMGGGDRVIESLGSEVNFAEFLRGFGLAPTFMYYTGPDQDDFDHTYRLWSSGAFEGDSILVLNEGLAARSGRRANQFDWLFDDERYDTMRQGGVIPVLMPALGCIDHLKRANLTEFEAIDNKPLADGTFLNPLWRFMTEQWVSEFRSRLEVANIMRWLP